jgi:RNA polymerase sigma-70 factor (ECF subfamily)
MATSKVTVHPSAGAATGRSAEQDLVDRCRRGELGAFEELYRAHSGRLFSLAVRMLGNPADAEDQLQEIFLSAHRKLESFRGESALGTWLYRLAMNQLLDHVRSRAARTGQLTDGLDDATVLADAGGHKLADRAIDRIDVEGLEHKEVSEVLGIAEGTSKSQVHKARLRLRGLLRERR